MQVFVFYNSIFCSYTKLAGINFNILGAHSCVEPVDNAKLTNLNKWQLPMQIVDTIFISLFFSFFIIFVARIVLKRDNSAWELVVFAFRVFSNLLCTDIALVLTAREVTRVDSLVFYF